MLLNNSARRKEEIEKKKQKLLELRKAREDRQALLSNAQNGNSIFDLEGNKKEIDELVSNLLGKDTLLNNRESSDQTTSEHGSHSRELSERRSKAVNLTTVDLDIIEIPPKETLSYSKEIQTEPDELKPSPLAQVPLIHEDPSPNASEHPSPADINGDANHNTNSTETTQESSEKGYTIQELDDEKRLEIINTQEFQDFFDFSTKIVERALHEKYDVLIDYRSDKNNLYDIDSDQGLQLKFDFYDERWSKNRTVTALDWSKRYNELCLAAYNCNPVAVNDPDGVVMVWNMHLPQRPEFIFHSQSDVISAQFSPFNPQMIVGGTSSGQVVIWDIRSKHTPVLKTPLTTAGHTHPVYSLAMVGSQNAHNLISASTDGTVCVWQLDMLVKPQESMYLSHPSPTVRNDEISVSCMSFASSETGSMMVGTEEGTTYQVYRFDRAGSKAGINLNGIFVGHEAMVTSIHHHPLQGPIDFSDVFLTSSMDWTVKLWKSSLHSNSGIKSDVTTTEPLTTFECWGDYVYDAQWSPSHPSIFATVDGNGKLSLFNLNHDRESPVDTIDVSENNAIHKLAWDRDGRKIATGSSDGHVHIFEVSRKYQPTGEDYHHFQRVLLELEQ